jgi:5-methylthioadenosine/S-adenosylhomocysteine deaminase
MQKTLIRNCDYLDIDTMEIVRADILVNGTRIESVDHRIEQQPDHFVVEAGGKLCLPAFVDAHTHMVQTFLKGPMDDLPITEWLVRMFSALELMSEEEWYYSVLVGCLQSLRFGVTTVNEMIDYRYLDATVQAYRDAGLRVTLGLGSTDIAENEKTSLLSIDEALRRAEELYQRYHGANNGLLRTSVAPAGLPACSMDFMRAHKQFADERGILFHTHLAEGRAETRAVRERTGYGGEAEALAASGAMDENTVLAHSIWLEDYELDLIKETGASILHCPNTNMKISDGVPKIYQMLERGTNVAMGCDGEASSSTRDIIGEVRAGSYLQKAVTLDPKAMSAEQCVRMITQNGARALKYDDIGAIVVGNRADIVLVDTDHISLTNRDRRLGNLIYAGSGYAVDTVFVEGRMVVRDGRFVHIDGDEVVAKSNELLDGFERKLATL